ncbi:MAG: hypothetical protein ACXU8O_01540, partial [Asticcacaulis sp.]
KFINDFKRLLRQKIEGDTQVTAKIDIRAGTINIGAVAVGSGARASGGDMAGDGGVVNSGNAFGGIATSGGKAGGAFGDFIDNSVVLTIESVKDLSGLIRARIQGLPPAVQQEVLAALQIVDSEAASFAPKQTAIKTSLKKIWEACQQITANVAANEIADLINHFVESALSLV